MSCSAYPRLSAAFAFGGPHWRSARRVRPRRTAFVRFIRRLPSRAEPLRRRLRLVTRDALFAGPTSARNHGDRGSRCAPFLAPETRRHRSSRIPTRNVPSGKASLVHHAFRSDIRNTTPCTRSALSSATRTWSLAAMEALSSLTAMQVLDRGVPVLNVLATALRSERRRLQSAALLGLERTQALAPAP
jgi:hypothetical protein